VVTTGSNTCTAAKPKGENVMKSEATWSFEVGTRGVLAAGRWLPLRSVGWAALLSGGTFAFFESTFYLRSWLHLPPNFAYLIFAGVPILAFVAYAAVVQAAETRKPIEVMPYAGMLRDILIGAAIGFSMLCATTALLWSLGLYRVQWNHWQHIFDSFLFSAYLSGTMEELLFRAILLRILARAFGAGWGLVVSSTLFGLAHLGHGSQLAPFEIMINGGLTLGLLYMVTGRLWMSVGMHTAWDFTEDSVLGVGNHNGLLLSTPVSGKSDLLTGGHFGPDASLLSTIIGILVILAIIYASKKGFLPTTTTFRSEL
jgi:membrane protease YdiL (CAAX protease family)